MWPEGTLDQCSIRAATTAPATPTQASWDFMMAGAGVRVSMAGVAFVIESREMTWSEMEWQERAFQKTGTPAAVLL